MAEQEKRHTPFVPLYRDIILAAAARCGAQALGCLCLLAYQTGQHKGWGLDTSLRELAGSCGVSLNTLRGLLARLEQAELIETQTAPRCQTRVILKAFLAVESGQTVSKIDTAEKIFAKQNKTVSKIDTAKAGLAELFPQFMLPAGAKTGQTVSNFDTDAAKTEKAVSKTDTAKTVSKFDTVHPLHTTPYSVSFININNKNNQTAQAKKQNVPVSLDEVKAYFLEKNYITSAEDFYYKNEARGWTWTDARGKSHKIKNWKGCAYEFEKKSKARAAVNWAHPQKTEEQLFAWYYQMTAPEAFANETARDGRWAREKGDFAFIASVAGDLERGKQILIRGAESLEKAGFAATVRAVANNAMRTNEELNSLQNKGN
nr:MAG TPA: replication protein O [Caudoviricetes sp.]